MIFFHTRKYMRVMYSILMTLLILTLITPAQLRADSTTEGLQAAHESCTQGVAVPPEECLALVRLYETTGGLQWTNSTGWLTFTSPIAPCDWYGVVCANGHVIELALTANRLTGAFPVMVANLPHLEQTFLSGNHLSGPIPPHICRFAGTIDIAYNALSVRNTSARGCLSRLDPDWLMSQTVAPINITPVVIEDDAVELSWKPIVYTDDAGYYEIGYATQQDGPYMVHGHTVDKRADRYRVDGLTPGTTYFFRIRTTTLPHAEHLDEIRSGHSPAMAVTQSTERILLMVYFAADNDLSPYIDSITERLRQGSQFNPNVQIVLFVDGTGVNDTKVLTIANGQMQETSVVEQYWGKSELNTADPDVLTWFLTYARETFPADRAMVSLMGHGIAMAPQVDWPTLAPIVSEESIQSESTLPPLAKSMPATPDDVTDRGFLGTVGLGQALAAATDNGTDPFDLLFFDQCFQGNLDTLYEVRNAADIFIASPNYAWLAAPYDQYIMHLAPARSTQDIAAGIVSNYQRNLDSNHPNVIFSLSRTAIEDIAVATNSLGEALQRAIQDGITTPIGQATSNSKYVDTTQCGEQNFTLGPPDELIGLGTFSRNLWQAFPANESYGVRAATEQVRVALTNVNKSVRSGSPHIAPSQFWDYDNSVTILAPLPLTSPSSVAWRSSIYTETMPLQAAWTIDTTTTVIVTEGFAYARDGSWDDFLATWYDGALTPTIGEWCHYTPPTIIEGEEVESLTLNAEQTQTSMVQLTWDASTDEALDGYWVYIKSDLEVSWTAHAILRPHRTTITLEDLESATEYSFLIIAQDATGVTVARSNEAALTTP